ncbi:hypothetical protein WA026_009011 [Henosepilachna vigintioctopunctata]|uniref:Uncharacterized protein n=1 Tax=Henosepilachna vigintioctopunctata TaxID=420089 RepID=A0AAW1UPN7_9CUCU
MHEDCLAIATGVNIDESITKNSRNLIILSFYPSWVIFVAIDCPVHLINHSVQFRIRPENDRVRLYPINFDLSEIIARVLDFVEDAKISKRLKVHNEGVRTFDAVCAHILNSTFQRLQNQTLQRFQEIKSKMPRRESARRTHHLACESDIIETLHMRLTLMQMSFGKHIERKHCCFFPGEILDEVFHILHYIKVTPKLHRPYKVTDELFDLSTMAMEYFKEKIEPDLPEIAYFGSEFFNFSNSFPASSPHPLDASPLGPEQSKDISHSSNDELDTEIETKPQSNMVLRKRIRIIKQGMKRYNSQLSILRQDLKTCKRKTAEQEKQIAEQQKQLAEQQQQTLEYAARLDEYDKKNDEVSRKFSTLLQELNKCKTELQYWRSKSPAIPPFCTGCGNPIIPHQEELQALVNQGVNPEGLGLEPISDFAALEAEAADSFESQLLVDMDTHNIKNFENDVSKDESESMADDAEMSQNVSGPSSRKKRKLDDQAFDTSSQHCHNAKKPMRHSKVRSKSSKRPLSVIA